MLRETSFLILGSFHSNLAGFSSFCWCRSQRPRSFNKITHKSLVGPEGSGLGGNLLYSLANQQCTKFKTCGDLADSDFGTAHVNLELFRHWEDGIRNIRTGRCNDARANKVRIEQFLLIPLLQGTLQMAYRKDYEQDYEELAAAEGAAYAAAVLPWVHSCNVYDAETIHTQMWTGRRRTEFRAVKHALGKLASRREGKQSSRNGFCD
jgi:hypothetical protein